MLAHRSVTPSIKFASTHLYIWVERGTVRVECLAQEHNAMPPARVRTWTARSGVQPTHHEATAPPHWWIKLYYPTFMSYYTDSTPKNYVYVFTCWVVKHGTRDYVYCFLKPLIPGFESQCSILTIQYNFFLYTQPLQLTWTWYLTPAFVKAATNCAVFWKCTLSAKKQSTESEMKAECSNNTDSLIILSMWA